MAQLLLKINWHDNNKHFQNLRHLLTICLMIFNHNCKEILQEILWREMVKISQLWVTTKCHHLLTLTPKHLMLTYPIMLIKQGSEKHIKPLIIQEVVCQCSKEMSLQQDHVYPIMILKTRSSTLNPYHKNLKIRWTSKRSRQIQDLLSSGRQVKISNQLIRVRRMPQVMLLKICKTRSAGFVLALSKKEHQLKMGNLTNSFVHASAPVQWE